MERLPTELSDELVVDLVGGPHDGYHGVDELVLVEVVAQERVGEHGQVAAGLVPVLPDGEVAEQVGVRLLGDVLEAAAGSRAR